MTDEDHTTPAEVRNRMREYLDHNLAQKLQDEEFNLHFDLNRSERRLVGSDVKISKSQQKLEEEEARMKYRQLNKAIENEDEALAKSLAAQFEEEERKAQQASRNQLLIDEEFAKSLALRRSTEATTPLNNIPTFDSPLNQYTDTPPLAGNSQLQTTSGSLQQANSANPAPLGIALPGLVGLERAQMRTEGSLDEAWPSPPVLPANHSTSEQLTTIDLLPSLINPSYISGEAQPNAPIALSTNNPFYNDVLLSSENLNRYVNLTSSSMTIPKVYDTDVTPATPDNSLNNESAFLQPYLAATNNVPLTTSPNYSYAPQGTDEFGLPLPSALALGLCGIPNRTENKDSN